MKNDILRTALCRILSNMLDNPDGRGIYPTGECMDRLEGLVTALMACPQMLQLTGSEALYAFIGELTTSADSITFGSAEDCAGPAAMVGEFCQRNRLDEPRSEWTQLVVPRQERDGSSSD